MIPSISVRSLNTLRSFVFELCADKQIDRQTNKQTDGAKHPTHSVGVGNKA